MLPRTRLLYALAAGAALVAAGSLGLSLFLARSTALDPSRVNKAGFVRGYIQRAAKWGLHDAKVEEMTAEVERVLGEAERSLGPHPTEAPIMAEIWREWAGLKATFNSPDSKKNEEIFSRSERLWQLTVELVNSVQRSSEIRAGRGRYLAFGLFGLLALAAAVLIVVRSYVAGKLEAASIKDALTGLYNRRFLELQLEQEALRAERYAAPFSLISFDLDHFKEVNDQYGHVEGDRVLRAVAEACSRILRKSDLLFRLGGDEFVAILPATEVEEAREAAEKLRGAIIALGNAGKGVTASLGLASHQPGLEAWVLLAHADKALYEAKAQGRNQVRAWEPSV